MRRSVIVFILRCSCWFGWYLSKRNSRLFV